MLDESRLPRHHAVTLAGRILFTLIFFLSGVTHFTDIDGYTSLMHESIPFRTFWVLISGVVELSAEAREEPTGAASAGSSMSSKTCSAAASPSVDA